KHDCAEQWSDKKTEKGLHVVHDAGELHHQIGCSNTDKNAYDRRPTAHTYVVIVATLAVNQWFINVVGPNGGEGSDVAGHAGHEASDERGDTEAQQAGAAVSGEDEREDVVIAVRPGDGRYRFGDELFG